MCFAWKLEIEGKGKLEQKGGKEKKMTVLLISWWLGFTWLLLYALSSLLFMIPEWKLATIWRIIKLPENFFAVLS